MKESLQIDKPAVTIPSYCDISDVAWTESDGSWYYTATVTAHHPFTPSSDAAVHYYNVKADNQNGTIGYWTTAGTLVSRVNAPSGDAEKWSFVGNWKDGFKIYNYNGKAIYNESITDATTPENGTQAALSDANATVFELLYTKCNSYGEFKTGNHYLSLFSIGSSYISYYHQSHTGSKFYFVVVEDDHEDTLDDIEIAMTRKKKVIVNEEVHNVLGSHG